MTLVDAADDPVFEPALGTTPLWSNVRLTALFPMDANLQDLEYTLRSHCERFDVETLADKDWERVWLEDFKPQCFGNKLWVVPSGYRLPEDSVSVRLDPGLAFGTGDHPTTKLCLTELANTDLEAARVLDYGCGSGILSLAAHKMGAERVVATDIDPQAVLATKLNALRNDIESKLTVCAPNDVAGKFDSCRGEYFVRTLVRA